MEQEGGGKPVVLVVSGFGGKRGRRVVWFDWGQTWGRVLLFWSGLSGIWAWECLLDQIKTKWADLSGLGLGLIIIIRVRLVF